MARTHEGNPSGEGVAAPNKDATTPDKVLREADKVLYKAKEGGRNRVAM